MANGSKLHILSTNCHLLATQQEPYQQQKTRLTLNEKYFLERKKSGECTSRKMTRQKEQGELGRKRRDIGKGNQKTVPRFQTGGKWPSYIPGLPSGPPNVSLEETQQQTDCLSRSFTHTSTHTCTHTQCSNSLLHTEQVFAASIHANAPQIDIFTIPVH